MSTMSIVHTADDSLQRALYSVHQELISVTSGKKEE